MFKPLKVKALQDYKIWVKYSDGVEGEVDNFVGKSVFKPWDDYDEFKKVYIGDHGEIAWSDKIDLCPDSIYMKITGRSPEQVFPKLQTEEVNA